MPNESSQSAPAELNVMSHIAHQLTFEGPATKLPKLGESALVHGFITSVSLDDMFEKVFGADE